MLLNVHSDASYLSVSKVKSQAGGYFFIRSLPTHRKAIQLHVNIMITYKILKLPRILQLTLGELDHPQPQTPIHINNTIVRGIRNSTIKRQRLCTMEMRYFWLIDQMAQQYFNFYYQPGQENLADYPTKQHTSAIHQHI